MNVRQVLLVGLTGFLLFCMGVMIGSGKKLVFDVRLTDSVGDVANEQRVRATDYAQPERQGRAIAQQDRLADKESTAPARSSVGAQDMLVSSGCKYNIRQGGPQTAQPGTPCIPPAESWPYKTNIARRAALGERVLAVLTSNIESDECDGFKLYERHVWCVKAFGSAGSVALSFGTGTNDPWSEQIQAEFSIPATFHSCGPLDSEAGSTEGVGPKIQYQCLGLESHKAVEPEPAYKTVESLLSEQGMLSTHLRIDTEVSGWMVLERLMNSDTKLLQKIRTLDVEVSLGAKAPFETEFVNSPASVLLERHTTILESFLTEFRCVGSNIEAFRQGWRPHTDCPEQKCEEPDVHTNGGFSPRRFAVSFINRRLVSQPSSWSALKLPSYPKEDAISP